MSYKTIVTHEKPHLDEIGVIWLLKYFDEGEKKFPGIRDAKIEFWGEGGTTPDGRNVKEWEKDGFLMVGVGGGRLDEHKQNINVAADGECAFSLARKELGLDDNPALDEIDRFILRVDSKGGANPFDISSIVKAGNNYSEKTQHVINWAMLALQWKYMEQLQFFELTRAEFDEKAEIEKIETYKGTVNLVVIESDDPLITRFARSTFGCEAAVVIQKQHSGNVQISTNKKFAIKLHDVIQILRLEEQKLKGGVVVYNWQELSAGGKLEAVPEWYFHEGAQMLLNGSLSCPNIPPTQISLDNIKRFVQTALNPDYFDKIFGQGCRQGICCDQARRSCSLYQYGLRRCRKIRSEQRDKVIRYNR